MHIFAQAQRVIQSLKQHDCSAALAWCDANRARLRKAKSSLEFKLRLQEFLELVAKVRWGARQAASNTSIRG
jgi:macrophage erythroblast attacher